MNGCPGYVPNPPYQILEQSKRRRSITTNSEPVVCPLCGVLFIDKTLFAYHLTTTHLKDDRNTQHQNNRGQSENKRKSVAVDPMPSASSVRDKSFFDKVSLLDHSESHRKKDIPNPRLSTSSLASLQHYHPVTLNSSKAAASSEKRVSVTSQNKIPRITDYSTPHSFISKSKAPIMSVGDVNSVQAPVLKPTLPLISYFGSLWGSSQSSLLSAESSKETTWPLSYPLFISQLGTCRVGFGLADVPSNKQGGGERFSVNQVVKAKEIIVISDDEENDPKSDVDLTLKL